MVTNMRAPASGELAHRTYPSPAMGRLWLAGNGQGVARGGWEAVPPQYNCGGKVVGASAMNKESNCGGKDHAERESKRRCRGPGRGWQGIGEGGRTYCKKPPQRSPGSLGNYARGYKYACKYKLPNRSPLLEDHLLVSELDLDLVDIARDQLPLLSDLQSAWPTIRGMIDRLAE